MANLACEFHAERGLNMKKMQHLAGLIEKLAIIDEEFWDLS